MSAENALALKAWNMMRGLEWSAIPVLVDLLEIEDVEAFIVALVQIREHQVKKQEKDAKTAT